MVFATSGPGATNLVTGIANAYLDSVPMIAVTGNVTVNLLGKDSFQEVDIVGITQPVVKHNFIVRDVGELESVVTEAFAIATSGRPGPVLIDIPKSVQRGSCEYSGNLRLRLDSCGSFDITRLSGRSRRAKTAIYCGGSCSAAPARRSRPRKDSYRYAQHDGLGDPHSYELNLGMCGMRARPSALMRSRALISS